MRTLSTQFSLIGPNLEPIENAIIHLNEQNTIVDIDFSSNSSSTLVAIPAYFNAHIHAADIGLRQQIGDDLHQAVGSGGTKHQYLSSLTEEQIRENIEKTIAEGKKNGVLGFADFREGGLEGIKPYNNISASYIPFARPLESEISQVPLGLNIGIRDVVAYPESTMKKLINQVRETNGMVAIHVSEDQTLRKEWISRYGVSDMQWAVESLQVDTLVHVTHADQNELELLPKYNTNVVICPSSNQYFGVGKPPVKGLIDLSVTVGLGSDNAMVNPIALWNEFDLLDQWGIDAYRQLKMATIDGASTAGLSWGIETGRSYLLLFDFDKEIEPKTIYSKLTSPNVLNYLVDSIYPHSALSDN